jgi:hypothetical protein
MAPRRQAIQAALDVLSIGSADECRDYLTDDTIDALKPCLLEPDEDYESRSDGDPKSDEELMGLKPDEALLDELLQDAYRKDPVSKEIFELLKDGSTRNIPTHLLKSGHHFSLADRQVRGLFGDGMDQRRLRINGPVHTGG